MILVLGGDITLLGVSTDVKEYNKNPYGSFEGGTTLYLKGSSFPLDMTESGVKFKFIGDDKDIGNIPFPSS